MPLYTRPYAEVVANTGDPRQAVRLYLALLEADLRETSLMALASWQKAGVPGELWRPALPNLFKAVAGLQEPAFGRWNGTLYALREALCASPAQFPTARVHSGRWRRSSNG